MNKTASCQKICDNNPTSQKAWDKILQLRIILSLQELQSRKNQTDSDVQILNELYSSRLGHFLT